MKILKKYHQLCQHKTATLLHRGGGFPVCRGLSEFVERFFLKIWQITPLQL